MEDSIFERPVDTLWVAVEQTLEDIFSKHAFLVDGLSELIAPGSQDYMNYLLDVLPPDEHHVQSTDFALSKSDVEPIFFKVHLANLTLKPLYDVRMPAGRERVLELLPHVRTGPDEGCFSFATDPLRLRMPSGSSHEIGAFELEADKGQLTSNLEMYYVHSHVRL